MRDKSEAMEVDIWQKEVADFLSLRLPLAIKLFRGVFLSIFLVDIRADNSVQCRLQSSASKYIAGEIAKKGLIQSRYVEA